MANHTARHSSRPAWLHDGPKTDDFDALVPEPHTCPALCLAGRGLRAGIDYSANLGCDIEPDVDIRIFNLKDPATGEMVPFPHFRREGEDIPAFRRLYLQGICILTRYSKHSLYRLASRGRLIGRCRPRYKDGRFAKKGRIEVDRDRFLAALKNEDQIVHDIEAGVALRDEIDGLRRQIRDLTSENGSLRRQVQALSAEENTLRDYLGDAIRRRP